MEDFMTLPQANRRLQIARHAIELVNSGAIRPTEAFYVLKEDSSAPCAVCAVGSLFISFMEMTDNPFLRQPRLEAHRIRTFAALRDHFSHDQLHLIEEAFMGWGSWNEFWAEHANDRTRMLLILQNIVDNDGEFVPDIAVARPQLYI